MVRQLRDSSGVALILTILIISLIVAVTLQFNSAMRSELHAAVNLRDGIWLGCVARSGFDYAQAVLYEDALQERPYDSLQEPWADAKALSLVAASMFEEGSIEVRIEDHSGRIQINRLVDQKGEYNERQKELVTRLLSLGPFGLEAEEAGNIIDAIKDWIDADNEVTVFGAESAYYKALERPYPCRNGPLESLEELLFVRGITRDLFFGSKGTPGISRYLSVYGDGRININTADPLVLRCLSPLLDEKMVEEMVAYRDDKEKDLSRPTWYRNVPGMSSEVSIDNIITTSSQHFEIRAEGVKGAMRKRVSGLVERKEGTLKILSWKVE